MKRKMREVEEEMFTLTSKTIKLTIILSKHEEGKAYEVGYIVLYITAGLSIRTQK
jgi:hypothetical protein